MPESLTASHVLEYPYSRSTGEVIGRFFAGLRERRILGVRTADGWVLVPPQEYDPASGAELSDMVEVSESGVVTTWAWVAEPRPKHLLQKPFAFALIKLDGADTGMLHMVDAGAESAMRTGMRVRVRWAPEPTGDITDILCFEPEVA
jgi:uncharacterized OB-fold protein